MGLFKKKKVEEIETPEEKEEFVIRVIGDPNDPVLKKQVDEMNASGNFAKTIIVPESDFIYSDSEKEEKIN